MNIQTEYELVKARGVELNPGENFDVQLYVAWKMVRAEARFWRRTCVVLAAATVVLLSIAKF